jgi:transcriptional regulator with XRE-family HTH domain
MTAKTARKTKLRRVSPRLDELLPTAAAREAYEDASAALEAGRLVRSFRERSGMTQGQLAERLSISQPRICAIERGEGRDGPSYALLKRIAAACGVEWPLAGENGRRAKPGHVQYVVAAKSPVGALEILNESGQAIAKVTGLMVESTEPEMERITSRPDDVPKKATSAYLRAGRSAAKLAIKLVSSGAIARTLDHRKG